MTLSSSAGCGRRSRISSSRARVSRVELAAEDRTPVLERPQELGGRVLLGRPGVCEPLDAVGVRVLRRREAAARQTQLAEHVLERPLCHLSVSLLAGEEPGVEVRRGEQRVVVEHLLEVRHEPLRVDGVAVEAAADEVVHPAGRHPVERQPHRVERRRAGAGTRAPKRAGTSARARSRPSAGRAGRAARARPRRAARRRAARATGSVSRRAAQRADERLGLRRDVLGPLAVRVGDRVQHLPEATAARAAARAGSTCRRRTAPRPA